MKSPGRLPRLPFLKTEIKTKIVCDFKSCVKLVIFLQDFFPSLFKTWKQKWNVRQAAGRREKPMMEEIWYMMWIKSCGTVEGIGPRYCYRAKEDAGFLPAGRIPICCWPSNTKLPIGWPSGLYAAPWLTEGSRRKPDCSQSWTQRKKKRRHTKQSAIVPVSTLKHYY